jgi:protein-S-isoprenylcysteine O-methyltransferase Ste14
MLWIALAALVAAIAVNCVAVWAQKHHRFYDRVFGRRAWPAHIALLVVVWGATIALVVVLVAVGPEPSWPLPTWVRPFGLLVTVAASVIFGLAIRALGAQALFNGNFFGRGRFADGGVYAVLADPMYVAYTLSFVSLTLREADAVYLLFALVSLVGLQGVEARVERIDVAAAMAATSAGSTPDSV